MRLAITLIAIVILVGIFGPQILFTVDETQLVVVTRFGEIRATYVEPGLKAKAPFIDKVNRFDGRVLRIDTPPARLNDSEKQILVIDAYSRYKITDVRKFFEKLKTLGGAENRLGSIVSSNLKQDVAQRSRQEIIGGRIIKTAGGQDTVDSTNTRQEILDRVLAAANKEVGPEGQDLGVRIIDVRIKRADFSSDIREDIFNRMRAERQRISRETRALGAEQDARIRAAVDRDKAIILADAGKQANLTKGEGEARAIEIFAAALEQDPEFFAFQRSLEAYKKFLSTNTTVILSSDAELFQFLDQTAFIEVKQPTAAVGEIEAMAANVWTVGGRSVQVSGTTHISRGLNPETGVSVFVEGALQADGTIVAFRVLEGISGRLDQISVAQLVVDDRVIDVNQATDVQIDPERTAVAYVGGQSERDKLVAGRITEGLRGTLTAKDRRIWALGAIDILVTDDTVIEEGAGEIGTDVLVSIVRKRDGSLEALKIIPQVAKALRGTLAVNTGDTWRVGNFDVVVDESTRIGEGADQLGAHVLVSLNESDDFLLAVRVVRQETAENGEGVLGTVQAIAGDTWTVGGFDFIVDASTQIGAGTDALGADVIVSVERDDDGSLVALGISLQWPIVGVVDSVTKEWTIDGGSHVITVDEDANIELGVDQVGLVVLVGFERQKDGSLLALEARIE